jgi:hypothetical protein
VPRRSDQRSSRRGILASVVLVVVALLGGAFGLRAEVVHAAPYRYDPTGNTRHGGSEVGATRARPSLASDVRERSASPSVEVRSASTALSSRSVATNTSRLVPGGGLAGHEALGGHTLARHVGLTDADLAARLSSQPGISAASTFGSRSVAESSIAATLDANAAGIQSWLAAGGGNAGSAFTHTFGSPVGTSLVRGAAGSAPVSTVRVVLRPDASMPGGFRILTAFPEL